MLHGNISVFFHLAHKVHKHTTLLKNRAKATTTPPTDGVQSARSSLFKQKVKLKWELEPNSSVRFNLQGKPERGKRENNWRPFLLHSQAQGKCWWIVGKCFMKWSIVEILWSEPQMYKNASDLWLKIRILEWILVCFRNWYSQCKHICIRNANQTLR